MRECITSFFKNDRSYLHGTEIFDAVMDNHRHARNLSVKFLRPLVTNPIITDELPADIKKIGAEFSFVAGGHQQKAWVLASDIPISERICIDESCYLSESTLLNGSIWQEVGDGSAGSFIQRLVALNKVLLAHEFNLTDFWFVKLTLSLYLRERSFIRIITGKNMADSIYDTILLDENDEKFGQIRFKRK